MEYKNDLCTCPKTNIKIFSLLVRTTVRRSPRYLNYIGRTAKNLVNDIQSPLLAGLPVYFSSYTLAEGLGWSPKTCKEERFVPDTPLMSLGFPARATLRFHQEQRAPTVQKCSTTTVQWYNQNIYRTYMIGGHGQIWPMVNTKTFCSLEIKTKKYWIQKVPLDLGPGEKSSLHANSSHCCEATSCHLPIQSVQ